MNFPLNPSHLFPNQFDDFDEGHGEIAAQNGVHRAIDLLDKFWRVVCLGKYPHPQQVYSSPDPAPRRFLIHESECYPNRLVLTGSVSKSTEPSPRFAAIWRYGRCSGSRFQ